VIYCDIWWYYCYYIDWSTLLLLYSFLFCEVFLVVLLLLIFCWYVIPYDDVDGDILCWYILLWYYADDIMIYCYVILIWYVILMIRWYEVIWYASWWYDIFWWYYDDILWWRWYSWYCDSDILIIDDIDTIWYDTNVWLLYYRCTWYWYSSWRWYLCWCTLYDMMILMLCIDICNCYIEHCWLYSVLWYLIYWYR